MNIEDAIQKVKNFLEKNSNGIILLKGNLGAGKTHFVNEFAKSIDVIQKLPSPTFSFLQEYNCDWNEKKKIIHCDFYRISPETAEKTLEQIGIWDYLSPKNILFIEWPEQVGNLLEEVQSTTVSITLNKNGERNYELS